MGQIATLPDRGVIEIGGEDRVGFLQGLVSNDVELATPGRAVWAALLTPQGKWLADFFIIAHGDCLLLDCERGQVAWLVPRLSRYRLRAKVTVADRTDRFFAAAAWDTAAAPAMPGAIVFADPRLPEAGWRILSPAPVTATTDESAWDAHRLALGLPDGSRDLEADKTVLLEAGFDELHGISWTKGCYMGQELTARTRYRGLLKRRLVPVAIDGAPPAPGSPVFNAGAEVGTMRSARDASGLAVLRLEALDAGPLLCGDTRLIPKAPAWMRLPQPSAG